MAYGVQMMTGNICMHTHTHHYASQSKRVDGVGHPASLI